MDVGPEAWKLGIPDPWEGDDETWVGAMMDDGGKVGVGGAEDAGLGVSTIHILWACVATSFATVCASEDWGLTWNTGYESLPSLVPLSVKITDKKWKQDPLSSGIELDFDVCQRYISSDVVLTIDYSQWRYTFGIH